MQTGAAADGAHLTICYLDEKLVSKQSFSSYPLEKSLRSWSTFRFTALV